MLDKSKPYGTVHGVCPYRFTQDGKCFNNAGVEVDELGKVKAKRAAPKKV